METNTRTVDTLNGHKITVFENDHIGQKIIKTGLYERDSLAYINQILAKMSKPIVLDVGANIGNHTLSFSTRAGKVFAFEPVPKVFSLLASNVDQNALKNVEAINIALSNTNEESELFMATDGNVGASSFDKRTDNVEPVTVTKRVGDEWVEELGIDQIDLLKIDVEGHELFVLLGLEQSIRRYRPFIIMEWDDPVSMERLRNSNIMHELLGEYSIKVLGNNYDEGYWLQKPFARIRRKITRWFLPKRPQLYDFNSALAYKNLLLIPKDKEQFLPTAA
ncbi:MAG: FkbM family methyltransferase [Pseudomonadales bacterium]